MADRRVRYILEVDYDGESAVLKAADDLEAVDDAAKKAGEGLAQSATGFDKVVGAAVAVGGAVLAAREGLEGIQNAAQLAYDTLKEGAGLVDARGDFEDLAAGIDMTADALMGDLSTAAAGLMTDAELVGQASELMALNLGLTGEEITKLTGLAAELDMDWQTLMDTLNTGSARGLKSLGLNIDEVKGKVAELEEAGMSADKAFLWAIIESGEAKLERVGKKSEETSGELQQLEVIVANVQDEFARGSAEGFAGALGDISGNAVAAGNALGSVAYGVGSTATGALTTYAEWLIMTNPLIGQLIMNSLEAELAAAKEAAARQEVGRAYQWVVDQYAAYSAAQEDVNEGTERQIYQGEVAAIAAGEYAAQMEWLARAAEWVGDAQERAAAADYSRATAMGELAAQQEAALEAGQAWLGVMGEMSAQGGDYFTQFETAGGAAWDLSDAIYGAADAAGAGAGSIGDLGVQLGRFPQATADAIQAQVEQQLVIDNLAQSAADGIIQWENYYETVKKALDFLAEGYPEPSIRENPRAEELAAMYGIDPAEIPGVADLAGSQTVGMALTVDNAEALRAVQEATTAVNDFDEMAPEITAAMDILAVSNGVGEIQRLLGELPAEKNITINLSATGMELIRELQALGAIGP